MADTKNDGPGGSAIPQVAHAPQVPQGGVPLKHDEIVSEEGAGSASIEDELRLEQADDPPSKADSPPPEFEDADNDLVNVGKFADEAQD